MKKAIFTFALLLCLALFAGCNNNQQRGENAGGEEPAVLTKLTVATMPSIDKVPMIVAAEKGFFAEHGVEVTVLNFQSPTDRNAALQSGELDGIMSDIMADILYLDAGMGLKMTSLVQTDFVVLASPASGITTFDDIQPAHSNGIAFNTVIEYVADKAGESNKVLLPSVMNRVEQIVANQIDLTIVPEPYGTMAVNRGAVKVGSADDLGIHCAAMIFTDEIIARHPEAIRGFYLGYEQAVQYLATADPADYIDVVIEKGEFSEEAADVIAATEFVSLKEISADQYDDVLAWMNAHPDLDGSYEFKFADITDFSFLAQ